MLESQLHKSSITSLLKKEGEQRALGRVRSQSLSVEMSLIGFIPYTFDEKCTEMPDMNDSLFVTPYLVKLGEKGKIRNVFKNIRIAEHKEYDLRNLYVGTVRKSVQNLNSSRYILPVEGFLLPEISEHYIKKKDFLKIIGNNLKYIGQPEDLEFNGWKTDKILIDDGFLCLCVFINKVTGLPSYVALDPDDTIRVLPDIIVAQTDEENNDINIDTNSETPF